MNTAPVPSPLSPDDVLQVLDAQARVDDDGFGPAFDYIEDYFALGGARLSVFRSRDGMLWVICIEAVRYDRSGAFTLNARLYGNCLHSRDHGRDDLERLVFVLPEGTEISRPHPGAGMIPRREFSIERNGCREVFSPSDEDYALFGLRFGSRENAAQAMTPQDALRFLCAHFGDAFFASEDTLRDLIEARRADIKRNPNGSWSSLEAPMHFGSSLSHRLELFLQTPDWTHPVWMGWDEADGEQPRVEAFRAVAQCIASGDLTLWHEQNPIVFNSHWSNWAEREIDLEESLTRAVEELEAQVQVLEPGEQDTFAEQVRASCAASVPASHQPQRLQSNRVFISTIGDITFNIGGVAISSTPSVLREWL